MGINERIKDGWLEEILKERSITQRFHSSGIEYRFALCHAQTLCLLSECLFVITQNSFHTILAGFGLPRWHEVLHVGTILASTFYLIINRNIRQSVFEAITASKDKVI